MKQGVKKFLCLMLSAIFVLSNCGQLFAQDMLQNILDVNRLRNAAQAANVEAPALAKAVEIDAPIAEAIIQDMTKELGQLKHDLDALRKYVDRLFEDSEFAEVRGFVESEINTNFLPKVEKSYEPLINEINAYDAYVAHEAKKIPMERLAYKYTRKDPTVESFVQSRPNIKGYKTAIEEGTLFTRMKKHIETILSKYRTQGVNHSAEIENKIHKEINAIFDYMEERLLLSEHQLARVTEGNEQIYNNLTRFVRESGTTGADVVEYAMKTIPEHDLKFLGLVKATEKGGVSKIKMTLGYRRYLRAVGSRQAKSSLFNLMKKVSASSLHARAYRAGYENLLNDFPVLPKRGLNKVARLGRQALRVAPIAIIGTFLTATFITEVRGDNHFLSETIGPRAMAQIAKKIDNGTASFGEEAAYFNSGWSDAKVEIDEDHPEKADPVYVADAINLSLAVGKTYENFDMIDEMFVEEEKSLAFVNEIVNEELQNRLDEQLATVTDRVSQNIGMI